MSNSQSILQNTEVGSIPSHWDVVPFREVCTESAFGPRFSGNLYSPDGNVATLRTTDVDDWGRISYSTMPLAKLDTEKFEKHFLKSGDLVITRSGTCGRTAIFEDFHVPVIPGAFSIRFRLSSQADNRFFRYYFNSNIGRQRVIALTTGTVQPNLTSTALLNLKVPLPPLDEQKAIARILSSLDDKIQLNQQMNGTLEAIARAIFKSWFVDFDPVRAKMDGRQPAGMDAATADLFPNSFENSLMGKIPKGWTVIELSKLCRIGRGASPRPITDPRYLGGSIPWIKIADATKADGPFLFETKEGVTEAGKQKSVFLKKGSLILSNSATCGLPIFIELDGCIHDGWLYFENLKLITNNYLYHVLLNLSEYLVHLADGSVQKNLNTKLVGSQIVLVPSQEILNKFEIMSSSIFNKIRENSRESRTLSAIRNVLLSQLLSGKVRTNL